MNHSNRFLEADIKALALERLKTKGILNFGDTIVSEFTVDNHSRRSDLLLVRTDDIWAIEIKSEYDSLSRLEEQVSKYVSFFDKVIVVCANKHTKNVLEKTQPFVEVWEINSAKKIKIVRRGKIVKITNKKNLLKLFKLNELQKLARLIGYYEPLATKQELTRILDVAPLQIIRKSIIDGIKARYKLTTKHFWETTENIKVTSNSVKNLSNSFSKRFQNSDITETTWLGF